MRNKSKVYAIPDDEFKEIIKNSFTYTDVLTCLGLNTKGSGSRTIIKKRIKELDISVSHFNPHINNSGPQNKIPLSDILVRNSTYTGRTTLKIRLIKAGLLDYKCSFCENPGVWNEKDLSLQLDHINGDSTDNRIENLRLLCPNCHSQTKTYSGKNNGFRKIVASCKDCNTPLKTNDAERCVSCNAEHREKIRWPENIEIKRMISENGWSSTSRILGVSVAAIKKHLKKNNINIKEWKLW